MFEACPAYKAECPPTVHAENTTYFPASLAARARTGVWPGLCLSEAPVPFFQLEAGGAKQQAWGRYTFRPGWWHFCITSTENGGSTFGAMFRAQVSWGAWCPEMTARGGSPRTYLPGTIGVLGSETTNPALLGIPWALQFPFFFFFLILDLNVLFCKKQLYWDNSYAI